MRSLTSILNPWPLRKLAIVVTNWSDCISEFFNTNVNNYESRNAGLRLMNLLTEANPRSIDA